MQSLYFMFFCVAIAYVIYYCLKNDDLAEFNGEEDGPDDKKFKPAPKNGSDDGQGA